MRNRTRMVAAAMSVLAAGAGTATVASLVQASDAPGATLRVETYVDLGDGGSHADRRVDASTASVTPRCKSRAAAGRGVLVFRGCRVAAGSRGVLGVMVMPRAGYTMEGTMNRRVHVAAGATGVVKVYVRRVADASPTVDTPGTPSLSGGGTGTGAVPVPVPAPGTPPVSGGGGVPAPAPASVLMQNYAFAPASVSVRVGATVTWTNKDGDEHSVKGLTGPVLLNGPLIAQNRTWSYTFAAPGTYTYRCGPHSSMRGTVVVTA